MKTRFTLGLALACLPLSWTPHVKAQSLNSTNAAPEQFWDTALGYFSSFNTNLTTFSATNWHGNVWAGADYQSGVNVASSLGVEYGFYKSLTLESVTRNAAIAGTILSEQAGLGVNFVMFDTQLTVGGGIGDAFAAVGTQPSGLYGSLFGEVKKAMTQTTFAGMRLETEVPFRSKAGAAPVTPVLSVFVGFRF